MLIEQLPDGELDEVFAIPPTWDDWIEELRRVEGTYGSGGAVDDAGLDYWRKLFSVGFSPRDAAKHEHAEWCRAHDIG